MPESRSRRKSDYTPPPAKAPVKTGNPRWLVPLMVGLLLLGLVWVVVYYLTSARYPIPGIGQGNLFAGFGIILVGFFLSTRWR
ncbi:MAG: cell division protein CrgA [Actinomycetes bacterium]